MLEALTPFIIVLFGLSITIVYLLVKVCVYLSITIVYLLVKVCVYLSITKVYLLVKVCVYFRVKEDYSLETLQYLTSKKKMYVQERDKVKEMVIHL